jgi:hypothetical protein
MTTKTRLALTIALLLSSAAVAQHGGRGVAPPEPPIEPSNLFSIPTGRVVRSLDVAVSASTVMFGEHSASGLGRASLGLGDIAEIEFGTLSIASSLGGSPELIGVPAGGLKVHMPMWRKLHGVGARFLRSGTYTEDASAARLTPESRCRLGVFTSVATVANFDLGDASKPNGGWHGVKIVSHLGANYLDARIEQSLDEEIVIRERFWRPLVGLEVWRSDARARIIAELAWSAHFMPENGGSIEALRVTTGGVRFFFSKHVTFDAGIRHQSNYDGLSESTIQTKLHFTVPTHRFRSRVVGN